LFSEFSVYLFLIAVTAGEQPVAQENKISRSDSKTNIKESIAVSTGATLGSSLGSSTANHLELPSNNNPNLLSPDILNQRRGL
jgi:potassium channel subfamily T member 1